MDTDKTTETIIGCAMKVSNTLGTGFLEKVYENALVIELRKAGLTVEQQKVSKVRYDRNVVGDYVADIVVNGKVILELKAAKAIDECPQGSASQLPQGQWTADRSDSEFRHAEARHKENDLVIPHLRSSVFICGFITLCVDQHHVI